MVGVNGGKDGLCWYVAQLLGKIGILAREGGSARYQNYSRNRIRQNDINYLYCLYRFPVASCESFASGILASIENGSHLLHAIKRRLSHYFTLTGYPTWPKFQAPSCPILGKISPKMIASIHRISTIIFALSTIKDDSRIPSKFIADQYRKHSKSVSKA